MHTLNPYLKPILSELKYFLSLYPKTNEHQIIKHLQNTQTPPFNSFKLSLSKDLFSAHFLCMHALYHLKLQYVQERKYTLLIHSVRIERILFAESQSLKITSPHNAFLEIKDPLESYYLDSKHYFKTQEQDINDMLKSFWKRYLAQDQKQAALDALDLPPEADAKMIKDQYKRLAQKHHPDKGGCAEIFNKVREAKSILDDAL
ncbi:MAG: DnaJ-domain-containing protein 1 [Oleiphilaceae bacterium]|jgi:DnaJ-domain-containing protein 1